MFKSSKIIDSKIKIIFVIPSLRTGGAERVMSFLATKVDQEKFAPHLLVIESKDKVSYPINEASTTFLNYQRVSKGIPAVIKHIRQTRPDIVMSAMAHVNTAMAMISFLYPKVKFIGRETSIASMMLPEVKKYSIWTIISKLVPKRLSMIVCQSVDMKNDLIENMGYPENKLIVINNPISNKFKVKNLTKNTTKQLITVGRLVKLKGHERIISALGALEIPFHYTIIGDGPEKETIIKCSKKMDIDSKITFVPFSNKIDEYLSKSDIFLQGSYSEGFPNALLESCAVGTPVLTFASPGGTSEIVEADVNGFIAQNEEEFREKLVYILNANWSPVQVSESVTKKYNEEKILAEYEQLFHSTIKK